ncbi:uncharacterized protein BYT42DRAFT_612393 [Radiomyces spectabilis]|uniref:uncharacterized protein n=1 Tax=Radiomyces spectabilis TaxID=64574 RepID=UPI00221F95EF|nr:uncharacterized protein BYT42DRAFT_612393 [Radiomyces spectabilis]KAI8384708.1 hypothetical protein BYT42DRAFT_612393 [Radiomyces spectabilis]
MLDSFDFAAQVARLCMDEIRRRGMEERKILRKSAPNSVLLLKVFRQRHCTADDLMPVSIHSVATLMQDTLWCCQERMVPKKVWRIINYETCPLQNLSRYMSRKGEQLLVEILDFLVEVMQHKNKNLMDAYHLGEAMGKVTLGPADCDPIIAEKAGHFMTRMIIEHSKKHKPVRVDSGFERVPRAVEYQPISKADAAHAKAKSYDRIIRRIKYLNSDWISNAVGLRAMLDDDYEQEPTKIEEPWISIFSTQLQPSDAMASPLLYRIVAEASKPIIPIPADPFASSYLFRATHIETQIQDAFAEFLPLCMPSYEYYEEDSKQQVSPSSISHLKKINHSFSHMKLNLRKHRSHGMDSEFSNDETIREDAYEIDSQACDYKASKHKQMKSMMRKVIKMGTIVPSKTKAGPVIY